jgi:threonine dehydrogenase-like Zn-dependent dehydrogenase
MACLRLMASGDMNVDSLITHRVAPAQAQAIFETMLKGSENWLGVVVTWE